MYKPTRKEFNRYWTADSVIIADMVSEAPVASNNPHVITIEKMLVDMYCDCIPTAKMDRKSENNG